MTEQPLFPPSYETLILASSRKELAPIIVALLGLSAEKVDFIDPEQPTPEAEFRMEPDGEDPFEAVKFKLHRILELFKATQREEQDLILYASDIVFSADGQSLLKPSRAGKSLDIEAAQEELFERYKKPFLAEWNIVFGVADKQGVNMGNICVEADYPALTRKEISKYFLADANPGLKMAEIGMAKNLSFKLFLDEGEEPIIINSEEGYALLYQFIVQKLPTEEMFLNLLKREISNESHRYGLIVQGFLSLQEHIVEWQSGRLLEISHPMGKGTSSHAQ